MTNKRYHALDAARGLLMLLGVYFHIIVFHYAESPLGLFAMSMHYFRMHAFFLISGFFSALVLNRKGHYEMLNNRFKRIFLPLIIMAYPVLLLNKFSIKFNELRYENTFTESLRKSFIEFISKPWENFIPWDTGHLWFLSLLFGMSIFSFLFRNSFSKNFLLITSKKVVSLIFEKPWIGMLLFSISYSLLIASLNKVEAQGEGQWASWIWFFRFSGVKSFIAFGFFYFIGWQMYHYRKKMMKIRLGKFLKIWLTFSVLIHIPLYSLYSAGYNNPISWLTDMHRNLYGLNDNLRKQKVTFMIDMSNEEVLLGEGKTKNMYVCIQELDKPSGEKMMNIGNGLWSKSVELHPGTYHYKFRNGLYSEWDGPGWENGIEIGKDGCGYDKYNNRKFRLKNEDLTVGVFCWSKCTDCFGNILPIASYTNGLKDKLANRAFMAFMNFCVPVYVMLSLSFFLKFCNKPSRGLKYLSDSAYWIYIIHLPLTFFIPSFFHQTNIHYFLKFVFSSIVVTVIAFFTYHYFVRKTFIGKFLNGKKFE